MFRITARCEPHVHQRLACLAQKVLGSINDVVKIAWNFGARSPTWHQHIRCGSDIAKMPLIGKAKEGLNKADSSALWAHRFGD